MANGTQLSFDFDAPLPEPDFDPMSLRTEDGRLPYFVTARLMASIDGNGDFWDDWKDQMKEGY